MTLQRARAASINPKQAACFFFFLWIFTLTGFSYVQYSTHRHYNNEINQRIKNQKSSIRGVKLYKKFKIHGQQQAIFAASPLGATIATTKFSPPEGHIAPFWNKRTGELITVSSNTLLETKFARFEIHQVKLSSGKVISDWAWFEEPDQVNVAVQMSSGQLLMFEQSKYGLEGKSLAPIGGMVEPGESPLDAAIRETKEETQLVCGHWSFLGRFRVATNRGGGFCSAFLAQDCDRMPGIRENPFDYEVQKEIMLTPDELRNKLRQMKILEIKWVATMALSLDKIDIDYAQS
jgi:8-oxo-dGTP pyrophosphatase MutT (NUDIX family)